VQGEASSSDKRETRENAFHMKEKGKFSVIDGEVPLLWNF
jgi:hypothetical protein